VLKNTQKRLSSSPASPPPQPPKMSAYDNSHPGS
jgi:hypothetical protein